MNKEERQEGYYWTKFTKDSVPEIMQYIADKKLFWAMCSLEEWEEKELYYISPEPIKPQIMNKETQPPLTQEQIEAIKKHVYRQFDNGKRISALDHLIIQSAFQDAELLDKLGLQQKPTKTQDSLQQEKKCKPKSNWIKIEEDCEMPEDGENVLVVDADEPSAVHKGFYDTHFKEWCFCVTAIQFNAKAWMPLPPPPIN